VPSTSHRAETSVLDRMHARLARRTSTTRYIPEIDGVRFLCIAMVVSFHTLLALRLAQGETSVTHDPFGAAPIGSAEGVLPFKFLIAGQFGVEIFFAVSGFILALPFLSRRLGNGAAVDVRRYYLRRLTRLEPPYLLAFTLWTIVALGMATLGDPPLWPRYLAGVMYAHGVLFDQTNPVLGVTWSLEIEVQFYLLVPVLAWALTKPSKPAVRREVAALLGLAGLAIATTLPFYRGPALALWFLPFFMAGWILADVYVATWKERPAVSGWWDLAEVVGWIGFAVVFTGATDAPVLFLGAVPVWLILAGALRGRLTRRLLRNRWLTTIGGAAYSIYLLHYPILLLWSRGLDPVDLQTFETLTLVGLMLASVILASLLFFVLVERPCMDPSWPKKLASFRLRNRGSRAHGATSRLRATLGRSESSSRRP
jgi:peptidoglycan/LPS O-acetylase OafA/YrhL